jgi:N-acetylglucosaminyl-diphospho-decaprenol L-rhamnosyltransferase
VLRVAIVVVNHNTRDELERCLESVFATSRHDVIVVDNASNDGSPEMVEERFPAVRLIRAPNDGYGAGANRGFALANADILLLLNSDTRLQDDAAAALAEYLQGHPQAAIAGPRLRNPNGSLQPSCNHMPTPLHVLLYEGGLARVVSRVPVLRAAYLPTWSHDRPRRVPWVLGAAFAVRCDALADAGDFDTDFFLYWEEVDLCRRVVDRGWQVHFAPVADVVHVGGASVATYGVEGAAFFVTSLLAFYRKHYGRGRRIGLRLTLAVVLGARLALGRIRLHALGDRAAADYVRRAESALAALAARGQVSPSEGTGGSSA